jgi:CubicO group peptidase (beta-lactamase class C family)
MLQAVPGFADDRFAPVAAVFERGLAGDGEVGASLCVIVDGETVVDLWGGFADAARTRPWQSETIVNVYSCTKTMGALTALLLADRGELDLTVPVSRYWPEFAAGGKGQVTVAHLLSHSSGLSGWAEPITVDDLYDWTKATGLLAAQAPFWAPGTAGGYHVLTQGYLVGEVVRRVDGRTVGTVFRQAPTSTSGCPPPRMPGSPR